MGAMAKRGGRRAAVPREPLIGAHISIAGGAHRAPERAVAVGCVCMQIFTKSNVQWAAPPLRKDDAAAFQEQCKACNIAPVVAHNSYLINLASPDRALREKSVKAFRGELSRCSKLGLGAIIAHPGSHVGSGEKAGLRRIAQALNRLLDSRSSGAVRILLETTAGQGSALGGRFEHLAEIIARVRQKERVGVCYDTCHTFAAGYDIRTDDAYGRTMEDFDRTIGLGRIAAFHLNDAKAGLGSRTDRHEHIGRGKLGREAFRLILRDRRFGRVPKILETPKGRRGRAEWDVINLNLLRRLAEGA